jgi:hypothetical protein
MCLISDKTKKNRKKPVETVEMSLTKRVERMKVNCGTVLRTRMNIDDFALETGMRLYEIFMQGGRADPRNYF